MSLPESKQYLKQATKPFLNFQLGAIVFLVTDLKYEYPMAITDFDLDDDRCTDYYCTWLNAKGEKETESYPEECLILKSEQNG